MKTILPVVISVSLAVVGISAHAQVSAQSIVKVAIKSQSLCDALNEWAQQTGFQIVSEISCEYIAPSVKGTLTPQAALEQLLKGTPLTYEWLGERVVAVRGRARTVSAAGLETISNERPPPHFQQLSPAGYRLAQAATTETNSAVASTEQSATLEEVVVSAQRREQLLSNVPTSITAFSSEEIERAHIEDITDYVGMTPNVSFQQSGIRSERDISIRGVSNIGGRSSAYAFYVDDFNVVNGPKSRESDSINSSINPQLQDVERIEVLRGPQGTFFGRNATAGAVNVIMKKPTRDFHGQVSAGYARFDTWNVGGVVNLPLADETLFLRVSAFREETDGAVRNVNPATGGRGNDYTNARIALRALPSERLTIDLSANYAKENTANVEEVATGVLGTGTLPLLRAAGLTGAISDGLGFYPDNVDRFNHDVRDSLSNRIVTLVGKLEYELDAVTLTSITGYLESKFIKFFDADSTSRGYLQQLVQPRSDSFSQEIRLSSTGPGRFDWVIGALYAKDTLDQQQTFNVGTAGLARFPPDFLLDRTQLDTATKTYALFGEAVWHPIEKLDLTLGGRYTRDEFEQGTTRVLNQVPVPPRAGEVNFKDFSPRFALTYRATEDLTAYATVSRGYKAGGLNLNETQPQLPIVDYKSEKVWNYEGGLRLEAFNSRLRVNTSAFYMKWTDMQVFGNMLVFNPATNQLISTQLIGNAADATSKGMELELQARPATALRLGGEVGYADAKFEHFPNALLFSTTVDLSGKPLPRAPKWTAGANAEYGFKVREDWESFVRAEWSYRDETLPSIISLASTGFPYRTPSFSVWNFRAGVATGKFSASAYIENAFDKQYFTKLEEVGFAGIRVHPSYRSYGARFTLRFD